MNPTQSAARANRSEYVAAAAMGERAAALAGERAKWAAVLAPRKPAAK